MIRLVRTASIAPGKLGDSIVFAKQISAFIEKQTGIPLGVMLPVAGNPHRIAWRSEYPNLGVMEEMNSKLMGDPKYLELLSKGKDLFIAGSLNDAIWRTI
jgi:hypothetical protein